MVKIKAIIFDLDGVLVDSIPAHYEAYKRACLDLMIKISKDDYAKTTGLAWQESIPIFSKVKDKEKVQFIHDKKIKYLESCLNKSKPIEIMLNFLKFCENKYRLALATSGSEKSTNLLINHLNIKKYFNAIITEKDVKKAKPDPEIFLLAAKKINVKPKECLVVEDSDYGFEAAQKAGMSCLKVSFFKEK